MITLIAKDFKRLLNSPWGNLGMMSIPLVIALTLGAAFGGDNAGIPRVELIIENNDDSWLSSFYAGAFSRDELKEMFDVSVVDGGARALVENNEASAAIIIPEGFGEAVLNGRAITMTLIKNPARRISPKIAATAIEIMNTVLSELRMVLDEPLTQILNLDNEGLSRELDDMEIAAISVMVSKEMRSIGKFVFPPAIELKIIEFEVEEKQEKKQSIYLLFFPGLIVLGVFFVADAYMGDLLEEKRLGTLQRTITAGITPLKILVSKVVGCVIYCILSILLMRFIGLAFLGVGIGDPIGELLTLVSSSLALTGVMCVVFGLARTEHQGSIFSTAVVLTMSLLGGSMMPRQMMPTELKISGIFTPNYWCLEAWDALLIHGASYREILLPVTILSAIGLVTILLGSILLTAKVSKVGTLS
ncbi:ABC transporter permease [bacterium]|nr:ABC transporter permease [bacterium]